MISADDIEIKYNIVYIPNPDICPNMEFPSFTAMMDTVGVELEAARDGAYTKGMRFITYTTRLESLTES